MTKFHEKAKMPKLGPKIPYLGIFGLEFENNFVIFEISALKLLYLQNFTKKQKCLNLGPKSTYSGIFDQKYLIWVFLGKNFKNILSYLKRTSLNFSNCKVLQINKFA